MTERGTRVATEITEELVAQLGRIEGMEFPAERLPFIAARLREMHELAAVLDVLDAEDATTPVDLAPAGGFDPSWPEVGDA